MAALDRAFRFASELTCASTADEFVSISLAGLAGLVHADLWGFNDLDPASREMVSAIWPTDGATPDQFLAVSRVVWQHPVLRQFQQSGVGIPTRLSDIWDRSRYRSSALYRNAYASMGVEFQVAFSLADGPFAATIGFAANRSDHDFEDDELEMLAVVRPFLRVGWQRVQASSALGSTVASAENSAFVLVDGQASVRSLSADAQARLARAGVPVQVGGPVPEPLLGWLVRGARHGKLRIGRSENAASVELVAGAQGADRILAVRPVAEGLTAREREIVRLAGSGLTNNAIASRLGISERTVHKHLEHAFAKLGVTNRTAAAGALRDS